MYLQLSNIMKTKVTTGIRNRGPFLVVEVIPVKKRMEKDSANTRLAIICSKSTIETLKQWKKSV